MFKLDKEGLGWVTPQCMELPTCRQHNGRDSRLVLQMTQLYVQGHGRGARRHPLINQVWFNLAVPHISAIIMQTIMICSQFSTEVITSVITVYEEKETTE